MSRLRRFLTLTSTPVVILLAFSLSGYYVSHSLSRATEANERANTAQEVQGLLFQLASLENRAEAGETFDPVDLERVVSDLDDRVARLDPAGTDEPGSLADIAGRYRNAAEATALAYATGDVDRADELDEETEALFTELSARLDERVTEAASTAEAAEIEARRGLAIGGSAAVATVLLSILAETRRQRRGAAAKAEQAADERFRALVDTSPDYLYVVADDRAIIYGSPTAIGGGVHTVEHLDELLDALDDDDATALANAYEVGTDDEPIVVAWPGEESRWYEVRVVDHRANRAIGGRVITARDVTQSMLLRRRLERQATEDELTGLANRRALQLLLDEEMAPDRPATMALLLVDLDGFKGVNDTLGHPVGDELLRQVAVRLRHSTRRGEEVARLGGDEFAIVVSDIDPVEGPAAICLRLLEAMRIPYRVEGEMLSLRASIGVALADDSSDPEGIFRQADISLYEAKSRGGNCFVVFEPAMEELLRLSTRLEREMRPALDRGEFWLVYQPVVDVETEAIVGLEALMRWESQTLGKISPQVFIPAAESSGLIVELGRWALQEACQRLAQWRRNPAFADLWMSVNVSVLQLIQPDFVDDLMRAIEKAGHEPSGLQIEVTESVMAQDQQLLSAALQQIRRLGVRVALDDFGTGYASMSQLQTLPVDTLKIDRAFIDALCTGGERARDVVQALIRLGEALGLEVIAEGVERLPQLGVLRTQSCDLAQGFLFAQPMQPEQIDRLLIRAGAELTGSTTGSDRDGGASARC